MLDLHPQFLQLDGENTHVVLTIEEYKAILEAVEDAEDYRLLRESKQQQEGEPTRTHEEVRRELGVEPA